MKKKLRNYLFVDGSNLYAGQYKIFGPDKYLEFGQFSSAVEEPLKLKFHKILFYASYSPKSKRPTNKEKAYLKNEGLFYKSVKKTKRVEFFKGYRSKTSGKEKEVDVKLAVDIVDLAYRDKYDQLFLMSGDADFMHALVIAERLKKNINMISLYNRIPYRLSYNYRTFIMRDASAAKIQVSKRKLNYVTLEYKGLLSRI